MSQIHISIICALGAGHIYPALPLCAELVRRGYRVTCPVTTPYVEAIRGTGAFPLLLDGELPPMSSAWKAEMAERFAGSPTDPRWFEFSDAAWSVVKREFEWWLTAARTVYRREGAPDLVLYDCYVEAARAIVRELQCPAIRMSPHFAYLEDFIIRQNGICRNPAEPEFIRRMDALLASHEVESTGKLLPTEQLNVHFVPKPFQFHGDAFDKRFVFAGCSIDRPFRHQWKNCSGGKPIVLVSSASFLPDMGIDVTESYFRLFIHAFSQSEFHCILSIGAEVDDLEKRLGTLPRNFEINRHASHLEILPHTSVCVSHGGMRTTFEAICNGVPMISVPIHPTAEEVSYRAMELGLGILLPHSDLSFESMQRSVARAMNDHALRQHIVETGAHYRSLSGLAPVIEEIERFIRDRTTISPQRLLATVGRDAAANRGP